MSILSSSTSFEASYGEIRGSSPSWAAANLKDRGRLHTTSITPEELCTTGLGKWSVTPEPCDGNGRKHYGMAHSGSLMEPAVRGGHSTYYNRRTAMETEDPTAFRRSLRPVSEPAIPDRPDRRRWLPEPYGPPPRIQGLKPHDGPATSAATAAEPPLPHLARPDPRSTCLRESTKEYTFEKLTGSRVHVTMEAYRGTGLAGDLTQQYGPSARPEDATGFFKTLKDSPTFLRFVSSLPAPPDVSPHQRRHEAELRKVQAQREADMQLVHMLHMDELGDMA